MSDQSSTCLLGLSTAADGTCSVEIDLAPPFARGRASYSQIKEAAQAVYDICASNLVSQGGVAFNVGESGTRNSDDVMQTLRKTEDWRSTDRC